MENYTLPLIVKEKTESRCSKLLNFIFCCNRKVVKSTQTSNLWKRWQIWDRIREKLSKKVKLDKTYTLLLDLYSHRLISDSFKSCSIEPDTQKSQRDDLEFYIPQFW